MELGQMDLRWRSECDLHGGLGLILKMPDSDVRSQVLRDLRERSCRRALRFVDNYRPATVGSFTDPRRKGDFAQQRDMPALRRALAAAAIENVLLLTAVRADKVAHVLDDAQN